MEQMFSVPDVLITIYPADNMIIFDTNKTKILIAAACNFIASHIIKINVKH